MHHQQAQQYLILADDNDNHNNNSDINQYEYGQQQINHSYNNNNNSISQTSLTHLQQNSSTANKYPSRNKHNINNSNNNNTNINPNQQLQDLLEQSDTISNLYTQKKRLQFTTTDLSFFSKDCTQDFTNQQGYNQLVSKIHFQRSRNRQLLNELTKQKQNLIQKYLQSIMDEFKQLSDQNKQLRQKYKKQAGGGYKVQQRQYQQQKMVRNNSAKIEQMRKTNSNNDLNNNNNNNNYTSSQTPRNSTTRINSRKSITSAMSVIAATQQHPTGGYSSVNNNVQNMKSVNNVNNKTTNRVFFGVGGGNFYQTQKLDMLRHPIVDSSNRSAVGKMHNCESSINMHTTSNNNTKTNTSTTLQNDNNLIIQPSPRVHKRRQSQLTQRKDYPLQNTIKNYNQQFLMMCDDQYEMSFYGNEDYGRYSVQQQGKQLATKMMMMKNKYRAKETVELLACQKQISQDKQIMGRDNNNNTSYTNNKNNNNNNTTTQRALLNDSVQRASFKLSLLNQQQQQQSLTTNHQLPMATNTKNIFIEFLQTLLIEQHINSQALTETIQYVTNEQQRDIYIPSHHNIRYIEQLEKEIANKNLKLRQLQQVINVYKSEIEQIVGTDVKMVNQLMVELLEVKGRYMEMQQKVDNLGLLRRELQTKEKVKENILEKFKKQQQKENKESSLSSNNSQNINNKAKLIQGPSFPIPQSIQTLFQLLNINIPKHSKPIQYLNQIKKLPKNQDLFQAFDSKKRTQCNMKIKQVIDQIKQGRKKFNQVIKIYQARIVKLQQKIHKFKIQMMGGQGNSNRQCQDKQQKR